MNLLFILFDSLLHWSIIVFNYINDLSEVLATNAKLFGDDTSLFSVIHDSQTSANVLNKDLEMIHNWAFQWKMNFNPDPTKQPHEVIFSSKTKKTDSSSFSV